MGALAILLPSGVLPGGGVAGASSPVLASPSVIQGDRSMANDTTRLVGTWRKAESPACAALYPAVLRLEANGLHRGLTEPPDQFSTWDVGTWKVEGRELAISTANDAVVRYGFLLAGDMLRVSDPAGCEFSYRREG